MFTVIKQFIQSITQCVLYYQYYKLGDMFRFTEASSGQFLQQSKKRTQ